MQALLPMMMFTLGVIAPGLGSYVLGGAWMLVTVLGALFAMTGLMHVCSGDSQRDSLLALAESYVGVRLPSASFLIGLIGKLAVAAGACGHASENAAPLAVL